MARSRARCPIPIARESRTSSRQGPGGLTRCLLWASWVDHYSVVLMRARVRARARARLLISHQGCLLVDGWDQELSSRDVSVLFCQRLFPGSLACLG